MDLKLERKCEIMKCIGNQQDFWSCVFCNDVCFNILIHFDALNFSMQAKISIHSTSTIYSAS